MLNPSQNLSPTTDRVLLWCHQRLIHRVDIVNLLSAVQPNPEMLEGDLTTLSPPPNDVWISAVCNKAAEVVLGWGGMKPPKEFDACIFSVRVLQVLHIIGHKQLYHVGDLVNGNPRHGRHWREDDKLHSYDQAKLNRLINFHKARIRRARCEEKWLL